MTTAGASAADAGEPSGADEPDLYPGTRDGSNEALRAERDFWKHLFDSMIEEFPEAVIVVDNDGSLTHWNPAHEEIANIPAEEVLGRNAYEVLGTEGEEEKTLSNVCFHVDPFESDWGPVWAFEVFAETPSSIFSALRVSRDRLTSHFEVESDRQESRPNPSRITITPPTMGSISIRAPRSGPVQTPREVSR